MSILDNIAQLTRLQNRIGLGEQDACDMLCRLLKADQIPFRIQSFESQTPIFKEAFLRVDGESIACLPSGLKSGEITNNYNLISSLTSSQSFINTPNINFNPKSDEICLCNFYFAPAISISRNDVEKVMRAKIIKGNIDVEPRKYVARNILVGNIANPANVVFAHYDAYFAGATDNASGVAVLLELMSRGPSLLEDTLFVLTGNEELSYDYPVYWGRCFREFQRKNPGILESAGAITVVDSVGDGPPIFESDPKLIRLAFPVGDEKREILAKTQILTGDFDRLMQVYHSPGDVVSSRLSEAFLSVTVAALTERL